MNTYQIEYYLKKDPLARRIFKKACPRDQLQTVEYPSAYVVNSHTSTKPGEHWLAVFFDKQGRGEFFDSYGLHPDFNGFTDLMNQNSNEWIYNSKTVQSLFSIECGNFCIYHILFRCRGFSMRTIVSHFSSNLTENDRRISQFIRNL